MEAVEVTSMTTIAWDGKTLAADSQTGMFKRDAVKIHRLRRGLFGSCGALQDNVAVKEWLDDPDRPKPSVDDGFHGILIENGKVFSIENKLVLMDEHGQFFACGSGREYAMAAMHLGCDARAAVSVAGVFDHCTGGEIIALELQA